MTSTKRNFASRSNRNRVLSVLDRRRRNDARIGHAIFLIITLLCWGLAAIIGHGWDNVRADDLQKAAVMLVILTFFPPLFWMLAWAHD